MSVAPSDLGTQPVGGVACVFEEVRQLKVPVPFPMRFVSSYLFEGASGWTVVDPGYDYPPAREAWEEAAKVLSLDLDREVEKVVVTHLHPDHIGLARWMGERSGAPVFMGERETENARFLWDPTRDSGEFLRFLLRNGMDEKTARPKSVTETPKTRMPREVLPLKAGEKVELGEGSFRLIYTPGHTDHHLMLHDERRKVVLAGDHLLLKITPNIGVWPYTEPRPLGRYLASLESLRGLEADLVLPGHGPLFHDFDGRIEELLVHHEDRLDAMREAFRGEPVTPFEVSRRVFPGALSDYQRRFALAETLAHLELLEEQGRAERLGGEPVRYRPL